MNFTYAIGRKPVNQHWREVRLTTRPFPNRSEFAAVPDATLVAHLYRGPWPCAPALAVNLGAMVFTAPAAGRLSLFMCPACPDQKTHRVCGYAAVAFSKVQVAEHMFFVEASMPIMSLEEKLTELGRGLLDRAGDWIVGGWQISPLSLRPAHQVPAGGKTEKEAKLGRRIRS